MDTFAPRSKRTTDLTGRVFGRLTVCHFVGYTGPQYRATWVCRCDCGIECRVVGSQLTKRSGSGTKSCGCLLREVIGARYRTHGLKKTALYNIWAQMKARCLNPKSDPYDDYGGRGIRVCKEWGQSFEAFARKLGKRPSPGHSIDRIDNNGHYSCGECEECTANGWPFNCRWATRSEQSRNRRSNRLVEWGGEKLTVSEWAERTGINRDVLLGRLNAGWSVDRVMSSPVRSYCRSGTKGECE